MKTISVFIPLVFDTSTIKIEIIRIGEVENGLDKNNQGNSSDFLFEISMNRRVSLLFTK